MKRFALTALVLLTFTSAATAEDIKEIFTKVNTLVAEENYPKAMEELAWAKNELEKAHFKKISALLPAELAGQSGDEVKSQAAMGFQTVHREYGKGADKIKLSISGGSAGGSQGGLAGLGRMAAMMGNQPGTDTFRIEGRTANLVTKGNRTELTVFLESGSMMKLEQRNAQDPEGLKKTVEEIDLVTLDKYLGGKL